MRWATYRGPADSAERVGLVHNGSVYGLAEPRRLLDLLGDDGERLSTARQRALTDPVEIVPLTEARLRAPVPVPPSVRDFMAFEAHIANAMKATGATVDPDWYELPVFYFSNPAGVIGPDEDVPISPGSQAFDYELEVAAVVGLGGSDLSPDRAEHHIAGYTILCDWSARDLQLREMRQRLGPAKGKDGATSVGPVPPETSLAVGPWARVASWSWPPCTARSATRGCVPATRSASPWNNSGRSSAGSSPDER